VNKFAWCSNFRVHNGRPGVGPRVRVTSWDLWEVSDLDWAFWPVDLGEYAQLTFFVMANEVFSQLIFVCACA